MSPQSIIESARACLGTPFVHQGRVPGLGLDCAGLIVAVAIAHQIEHFDVPAYGMRPFNGLLEQTLDAQPSLTRISRDQIAPGDILLMRFSGEPQHLAIFAGDSLIHSWSAPGKVCEHRLDAKWTARIVRGYRFKGIES